MIDPKEIGEWKDEAEECEREGFLPDASWFGRARVLLVERAELLALLRECACSTAVTDEDGYRGHCAICGGMTGHEDGCRLAAALRGTP